MKRAADTLSRALQATASPELATEFPDKPQEVTALLDSLHGAGRDSVDEVARACGWALVLAYHRAVSYEADHALVVGAANGLLAMDAELAESVDQAAEIQVPSRYRYAAGIMRRKAAALGASDVDPDPPTTDVDMVRTWEDLSSDPGMVCHLTALILDRAADRVILRNDAVGLFHQGLELMRAVKPQLAEEMKPHLSEPYPRDVRAVLRRSATAAEQLAAPWGNGARRAVGAFARQVLPGRRSAGTTLSAPPASRDGV